MDSEAIASSSPSRSFHVHGLCVGLHGTLLAGASAVILPRFDVETCSTPRHRHGASLFFGVPTMYSRLAASAPSGRAGAVAAVRVGLGAPAAHVFERVAAGIGAARSSSATA